jgi:hypothetical protein
MPSTHLATDRGMNDGLNGLPLDGGRGPTGRPAIIGGWVSVAGQGSAAAVGVSRRS